MTKRLPNIILIIIGAFIFMIFALYNGYPIVNGDSTTYINSGLDLWVPRDRPVFYGLFIRFISMGASTWFVIFAQCMIMAYVSIRFIRSIYPTTKYSHLIALLLIISLGTIGGWNTSQLLADAFTPILFLSIYLYLRAQNNLFQKSLLLAIIFISITVHYSHYVIATCFVISVLGLSFLFKKYFQPLRNKLIHISGLVVIAWLCLFSSNYIEGYGFITSKTSHIFLMGKLCENGVLKQYLDRNCDTKNYHLCKQKETLPPVAWEFVWAEDGPMYYDPIHDKDIWNATHAEYKAIINDILTTPKYWPFLAYHSIEATFRQVVLLNIDEGEENKATKYEGGHPLYEAVRHHFLGEVNQFKVSKQNLGRLNVSFYDQVFAIIFLLTSVLVLFMVNGKHKQTIIIVYTSVFLYVFINAFATATFGNVLTRLNSRTIWLIPMTNIVFIYVHVTDWIENRKQA